MTVQKTHKYRNFFQKSWKLTAQVRCKKNLHKTHLLQHAVWLKIRSSKKPQYSKSARSRYWRLFQRLLQLPQGSHKLFEEWFGHLDNYLFKELKIIFTAILFFFFLKHTIPRNDADPYHTCNTYILWQFWSMI